MKPTNPLPTPTGLLLAVVSLALLGIGTVSIMQNTVITKQKALIEQFSQNPDCLGVPRSPTPHTPYFPPLGTRLL